MQLIDTDLTLAEREQVEAAMVSDKQVLWFGRPVAKAWTLSSALSALSGVVACGFLGYVANQFLGAGCKSDLTFCLIFCCFLTPFIIVALSQLLMPWRQLRRLRNTAYLLTAQQAMVLEPGWFGKRKLSIYPVQPGMVKERNVAQDGSGSLVFAYREEQGKHGTRQVQQGFLNIPQVQQVAEMLDSLTAGESAPAETPQEAVLSTPASGKKSLGGVIIGCVFALVGVGVLVGAGMSAHTACQVSADGVIAQGEVVSLKRERSSGRRGSRTSYYPVFRFTAQDGREYRVKHNQGSNPPVWKKGEKVELIYLPDNPETAVPDTFWGKYAVPFVLAIFGTAFTVMGSFVAWHCRKGEY